MKAVHAFFFAALPALALAELKPTDLRTEWLEDPLCVEAAKPRLSWRVVESDPTIRGQRQTAYRIVVASTLAGLKAGGDLWDTGKVVGSATLNIEYGGKPLASGQEVHWKVGVWDKEGQNFNWSPARKWAMGLLRPDDWKAQWISFKDDSPLHADPKKLHLPPARYYRKTIAPKAGIKRAMLYVTSLGLVQMYVDAQHLGGGDTDVGVGVEYFAPGWSDYRERAYYRAYDLTMTLNARSEGNPRYTLGAVVADGWYAGYVGYGLLVGYGPHKTGRNIYGKTPALLAQLEIEYDDGTRETIGTDTTWEQSGDGPVREADLIMGEVYDARRNNLLWRAYVPPGDLAALEKKLVLGDPWRWAPAIRAEDNGSVKAKFFEPGVEREVELGFQKPKRIVAYTAPPVRAVEELPAKAMTEPKLGVYIYDLGENFAGIIRLRVKAPQGTKVQMRYGEMLHPNGALMTENLRKARATDTYICRGEGVEMWEARFTYHGFRYVELTGLPEKPGLDAVMGVALSNDTPKTGEFSCSDEVMTQFWRNTVRTQKANFLELPTDCPQRDERLGWMGDAQLYARTATFNSDVAAFFTKWIDDVREAQRDTGAYPDYAPYPFAHGAPKANQGTAWTDAGVIVPHTMWEVYGDRRLIEKHWDSMEKFMKWRAESDPERKGVKIGNTWGDWLNVNEETPIEFIDLCYHYHVASLMDDMGDALGKSREAVDYAARYAKLAESFAKQYLTPEGALTVNTQSAHVLALWSGILAREKRAAVAKALAEKIAANDFKMATGFLGTKPLLGVLTAHGYHDLACRLFQSRKFPSWGYEVEQGATSVWERWDSYTKEHGFNGATGKNNAAMNSFSHYAFGAVMEWAFQDLAGIHFVQLDNSPSDGIVMPGTNLEVSVGADKSYNGRYQVRRGGYVILPQVGRIMVAGHAIREIQQSISKAIGGHKVVVEIWRHVSEVAEEPVYYVRFEPHVPSPKSNPDGQPLTWVNATYESPVGPIESKWKRVPQGIQYHVTIPANAIGDLRLPTTDAGAITYTRDNEITPREFIHLAAPKPNSGLIIRLPAGSHRFVLKEGTK